ncbi:hypothetical protein FIBSPDRAFT_1037845, partial [Athelia psychrophila]
MAWWTMNLMKRDYHHLSATVYLARFVVPNTFIHMLVAKLYTFSPVFFRRTSQSSCSTSTCCS